jgi:nucleoside-diphosphate-sugar epimerase
LRSLAELKDKLTAPSEALIADTASLKGDLIVLGAAGKIGPNIIGLLARADEAAGVRRRIYAVSRFSDRERAAELEAAGAILCEVDITRDGALEALPDAANVLHLVGARFGMSDKEAEMWFVNSFLPGRVVERFGSSRIVALSTGNVYPLAAVGSPWPTENTPPDPVGEYAMSCLGRERVMSQCAARTGAFLSLIRLNYSVEMRYGPIVDLARQIRAGDSVDLAMGHLNVVWQGYSNDIILRSFLRAGNPPFVLNVTGPELVSVRKTAKHIAALMGKEPVFRGAEAPTALLSDASRCHDMFGLPTIPLDALVSHTVRWVDNGLPLFSKATGFQSRKGIF